MDLAIRFRELGAHAHEERIERVQRILALDLQMGDEGWDWGWGRGGGMDPRQQLYIFSST